MTGTITCLNCGNAFTGNYCNNCGEKVLHDHDKTVAHFLEDGVHFITHFEGKFFTTLKTIFRWPGKLSVDYCRGVRQPYFKPLSFFLMIVILYLLFPRFQGLNMTLGGHMAQGPTYGAYATALRRFYRYKWKYNLAILLVLLAIHILIIYFVYKFILFITIFALL